MSKIFGCQAPALAWRFPTLRRFVLEVLLFVAMGCAFVATPAAAQDYRFSSVRIEGNVNIEPATILTYAGIKRGTTVSDADLNAAYQRIAGSGLFDTITLTPRSNTLIIKVVENPTINVITFEGARRYKRADLAKVIKSSEHHVYSAAQAEVDAATLIDFYRAKGRYAATVTPRIIRRSGNKVDLVFEVAEGKVTEVQRISIVGNRAYSDRRLRQVLATKQAGILHQFVKSDSYLRERIGEDKQKLSDFYQSRGYVDFQVLDATSLLQRNRRGFFLTFSVREGLPYKFGKMTVASEVPGLDTKDFEKALRIYTGKTYTPSTVQNDVDRLENLATAKGMNFVRVDPRVTRRDADQSLDIAFTLVKGPRVSVERIDIQGNTTTLDRVIRRQFHTAEGDPFNPRAIHAAADRIRALDFFSDVQVNTRQGSAPDQVVIDTQVKEKPTGSLSLGLSYGINSGAAAIIGFSEDNFLGRGQRLGFSLSTGVDNADSSISFVEPALLGRDLKFSFVTFYRGQKYNDSYFDSKSIGFGPGIEFPISANGRFGLHYTLKQDKMDNVDPGSSSLLKAEAETGSKISSILGYTYSYDTRRTGLNPSAGVLLKFGQDFSGVGGDTRYIKTSAEMLAQTKVVHEEVTLRADLQGGLMSSLKGDSRVTDRYFGTNVMRGFKSNGIGPRDLGVTNEDALGGNKFAVLRLESEFPLGLPSEYGINGGLFWDVGSVWGLDNNLGTIDDKMHLRSIIGFSIFWKTPIGPLRFNFSHALKKQSYDQVRDFDLTLSTQF